MANDNERLDNIARKSFGHGCNVTGELGSNNAQAQILDYDLLAKNNLLAYDDANASVVLSMEGYDYDSANQNMNRTFGCDTGTQSEKGDSFSNALSIASSNFTNSTNVYEFALKLFINKVAGVTLNPMSVDDIKGYFLKTAYNHLNGIKNDGEKQVLYPTDDAEALKKLFTDYGTHLITKAIYGCKYEYFYARESQEWESSRNTQRDLNLAMKYPYKTDFNTTLQVGSTSDYSDTDTECQKNDRHITIDRKVGGDTSISNNDLWQLSCHLETPSTVDMIGYVFPNTSDDCGLIPLWEFVEDEGRREKIKAAFQEYVKEHTRVQTKFKKVIADVIGRHTDGNAPEYIYEKDYTGKYTRKYYKLEPDLFDYISASTKGQYHFYYALGYSNNCGLTQIEFMDDGKANGSTVIARGDNSKKGVTGILTERVVAVTPALSGTKEHDLVSGFGVDIEGKGKKISKGSAENFGWQSIGKDWYKGLAHNKIHCIIAKDELLY